MWEFSPNVVSKHFTVGPKHLETAYENMHSSASMR